MDANGKKECSTEPFTIQKQDSNGAYCASKFGQVQRCLTAPYNTLKYINGKPTCVDKLGNKQCKTAPNNIQSFSAAGGICVDKNYVLQSVPPAPPTPITAAGYSTTTGYTSLPVPAVTVGLNGGVTQANSTISLAPTGGFQRPDAVTSFAAGGGKMDCNSATGGAQVGVWVPVGNSFYYGGELAANKTNNNCSRDATTPPVGPTEAGIAHQDVKINSTETASAILGYNLTTDFSVYGKVGFAAADANMTSSLSLPTGGFTALGSSNDWLTGSVAGVGVKYNVSPVFSAGLEFQHESFGSNTFDSTGYSSGIAVPAANNTTNKLDINNLVFKVDAKIG